MIKKAIEAAIGAAVEEINDNAYDVAGFALGTDNDAGSLFAIACTQSWVTENGPEMGLQFNEWPDYISDPAFNKASRLLFEQSTADGVDDDNWPQIRDGIFEMFVQSLLRVRARLPENAFLCIGSTDPSDHLLKLEMDAVSRLNTEINVLEYRKLMQS